MNHGSLKWSGLVGCLVLLLILFQFVAGMLARTDDALLSAAESGNMDEVARHLNYGADINVRNPQGITPLHFAALSGHRDVVEFLVSNGADVKARTRRGSTPLYFAVVMEHKAVADLLIEYGAKPDSLSIAALSANREIAEMLIARGVGFNAMEKIRIRKLKTEFAAQEEQNHWRRIRSSDDVGTVLGYLDKFPRGKHAEAAKGKLAVLEEEQYWQHAMEGEGAEAIKAYLDKYPEGRHAADAQKRLDDISKPEENEQEPETIVSACAHCPEMVVIPEGSFERIVDGLAIPVTLKSFSLGKTEVTQGQWQAVMGSNPSHFTGCGPDCPV